jgi:Ca2+/Na+ antiporter
MDTAKFFSAVAGTALCIGLLFDAGYFLSFDTNYFMLLSYKDHLSVLALFAVPCLFVAFLFLVFRTGRPNQSKSESESHKFDIAMGCWIALVLFLSVMPLTTSSFPFPAVIKFAFWFKGLSSFFLLAYLTAVILGAFLTPKGSDPVGSGWDWHSSVFPA